MEAAEIRDWLQHCPPATATAPNLAGYWIAGQSGDWYLCAACASRLAGRGIRLPAGSVPVWHDRPEPRGVCCGCE